jgi:hypothetical protein
MSMTGVPIQEFWESGHIWLFRRIEAHCQTSPAPTQYHHPQTCRYYQPPHHEQSHPKFSSGSWDSALYVDQKTSRAIDSKVSMFRLNIYCLLMLSKFCEIISNSLEKSWFGSNILFQTSPFVSRKIPVFIWDRTAGDIGIHVVTGDALHITVPGNPGDSGGRILNILSHSSDLLKDQGSSTSFSIFPPVPARTLILHRFFAPSSAEMNHSRNLLSLMTPRCPRE